MYSFVLMQGFTEASLAKGQAIQIALALLRQMGHRPQPELEARL